MITAIVDLQFGSTGKGLLAGYLSKNNEYDVVVSANMPNAGHTFYDPDSGQKVVNKVLPSGVYSKNLGYICIGPGAIFDPLRLRDEIRELRARDIQAVIAIHPEASLLMPGHKDAEKALNHISSTMQGSMEAMFHKMRRHDIGANTVWTNHGILSQIDIATDENLSQKNLWDCVVDHNMWHAIMFGAKNILMEGSQGYSLGINAGFYPYTTSRDCTVWRLLSDCCIPITDRRLKVIGSARVHPIRVGNTEGGNSGPCYHDQKELRWKDLGVEPETTTVTGRERRVFSFSAEQIKEAMYMNGVDQVFLNFCNYAPQEAIRVRRVIDSIGHEMMKRRNNTPAWLSESEVYPTVRYMGYGPTMFDVMELPGYD